MNKNKSIVDRIEAFTVKRDFKVGKVLFKTNEVYNRVDIFNEGEFFINFKYNDNGELDAVNEVSLNKLRKNFNRIKRYISVIDFIKNEPRNQAFSFDSVKSVVLNKDFNGLKKGITFTRNTPEDLFNYFEETKTENESSSTSYSFNVQALTKLYEQDNTSFLITEWFEKDSNDKVINKHEFEKTLEPGEDLKEFLDWQKNGMKDDDEEIKTLKLQISDWKRWLNKAELELKEAKEQISDWKSEYIKVKNQLKNEKDLHETNVKFCAYELENLYNLRFEINSLLKKYQSKLDNLDIVDELEFDKIEEGTVLENIVTVLKHLNKMD